MNFKKRVVQQEPKKKLPWRAIGGGLLAVATIPAGIFAWRKARKKSLPTQSTDNAPMLKKMLSLAVVIAILFLLFFFIQSVIASLANMELSSVPLSGSVPKDDSNRTNVLLLGQGDDDHDGFNLTDSIIVASVDWSGSGTVSMLSLPRDLYFLKTNKLGRAKINTFYRDRSYVLEERGLDENEASIQAMADVKEEIEVITNLEIHGVVKINFTAFVEAVDALGGIEINVPEAIYDSQYPGPNYTYAPFRISAGQQTIDGETALKYARSRYSTSDFDRSARQQQIIAAILSKVQTGNLFKKASQISKLYESLSSNIESTFNLPELINLANKGRKLDRSRLITLQLNDRNGLYGEPLQPGGMLYNPPRDQFGGAAVLLPISIPEFPVTFEQIQDFSYLFYRDHDIRLPGNGIHVYNSSGPSGSAERLGWELFRFGYPLEKFGNIRLDDNDERAEYLESFIAVAAGDEYLAKDLSELLSIPIVINHPELLTAQSNVAIVLGEDYTFKRLKTLIE